MIETSIHVWVDSGELAKPLERFEVDHLKRKLEDQAQAQLAGRGTCSVRVDVVQGGGSHLDVVQVAGPRPEALGAIRPMLERACGLEFVGWLTPRRSKTPNHGEM